MPIPWQTQADWDAWYDNYGTGMGHFQKEFDWWLTAFGPTGTNEITSADRILIIGGGHGYLLSIFRAAGYVNSWALDDGALPQSVFDADPQFNSDDLGRLSMGHGNAQQLRDQLKFPKPNGSNRFNWIIFEDVDTSLFDAELKPQGLNNPSPIYNFWDGRLEGNTSKSHLIHFVMDNVLSDPWENIDPAFNVKTLREWSVFIRDDETHSVVSVCTWEAIIAGYGRVEAEGITAAYTYTAMTGI